MFDINKLQEWKSALDEGFRLIKEIDDECDFILEKLISLEYSFKIIKIDPEKCRFIYEKNFNKFCEKVAAAILEVQE